MSSFTSKGLCSIISLALIALPHSPAYFKSVKSVPALRCHWSSFPQRLLRHHFSFWKNKGSWQNSDLFHNLFPDDIWPKNSAFWLSCCSDCLYTSLPCELRPANPLGVMEGMPLNRQEMWREAPPFSSTPFLWNLLVLPSPDNLQMFNEKLCDGRDDKTLDKMEEELFWTFDH